MKKELIGELIGTFVLVLFGCSSVAGAVLFGTFTSLFEVAAIWGLGVCLAIFISRNLCPAHLNPAVSLAMVLSGDLEKKKMLPYFSAQLIGAFLAGLVVFVLFNSSIEYYEASNQIVRGSIESNKTAMIFGEFFPNPGLSELIKISWLGAMLAEAFGTFILVFAIFKITEKKEQSDNLVPFMIGGTVTLIICLVAPFTQAGLNPARDFGPRLVAFLMGWGDAAFPSMTFSFFTVYIAGPLFGGAFASFLHRITK